ncbi:MULTISPECIES: DoxX family protein [Thalassospira]|jgi:hypothetical protein|uniref:DoxX family protein n=1 Tax=Thalassospira TaxID=168934 RepID=UPI0002873619|nr:DoxX family protein [Thalassospira profundimaris]EKF06282.1 hypothetical protein TH2_20268 [Thalassospira profundimaris WP0211]
MPDNKKPNFLPWLGYAASALVVFALLADGAVQFFVPALAGPMLREGGFDIGLAPLMGAIMVSCAILYAVPPTAVFGAILTTGFLGGAICTHVRLGEIGSPPVIISLGLGLLTWGGLYLRDPRIRLLLPIRRKA